MTRTLQALKSFANDEAGATSIEYALIAGIVSIAIAAGLTSMRGELQTTFTEVGTELNSNSAN
ncbi:MAG: Flp family type IVb pilin [Hyphomicrobium sp.]|nr:Flp family type IVb pilin [Hyphomicrobium sp.]